MSETSQNLLKGLWFTDSLPESQDAAQPAAKLSAVSATATSATQTAVANCTEAIITVHSGSNAAPHSEVSDAAASGVSTSCAVTLLNTDEDAAAVLPRAAGAPPEGDGWHLL